MPDIFPTQAALQADFGGIGSGLQALGAGVQQGLQASAQLAFQKAKLGFLAKELRQRDDQLAQRQVEFDREMSLRERDQTSVERLRAADLEGRTYDLGQKRLRGDRLEEARGNYLRFAAARFKPLLDEPGVPEEVKDALNEGLLAMRGVPPEDMPAFMEGLSGEVKMLLAPYHAQEVVDSIEAMKEKGLLPEVVAGQLTDGLKRFADSGGLEGSAPDAVQEALDALAMKAVDKLAGQDTAAKITASMDEALNGAPPEIRRSKGWHAANRIKVLVAARGDEMDVDDLLKAQEKFEEALSGKEQRAEDAYRTAIMAAEAEAKAMGYGGEFGETPPGAFDALVTKHFGRITGQGRSSREGLERRVAEALMQAGIAPGSAPESAGASGPGGADPASKAPARPQEGPFSLRPAPRFDTPWMAEAREEARAAEAESKAVAEKALARVAPPRQSTTSGAGAQDSRRFEEYVRGLKLPAKEKAALQQFLDSLKKKGELPQGPE